MRRTLSATDLVTLYGVSPYSGANEHQVYMSHVHPEPPSKGSAPMALWRRMGMVLEPLGLQILAEEMDVTLRRARTRVCDKHPWLIARPDALVVANTGLDAQKAIRMPALGARGARRAKVRGVGEIKLVSDPRMAQLWFDARPRPPLYVHVQAQAEMTAYGVKKAMGVGLIMGNPYVWELDHDDELEAEIVAIGENFLKNHIEAQVPPAWDGSKTADRLLMRRWPKPDETFRRADLTDHALAIEYLDAQHQIEVLTTKRDTAEQALKDRIADRIGLLGDGWKATWKAPRVGWISWKGIAKEISGRRRIPAEVIASHTGEPTRRFRMFEKDPKLAGLTDDFDMDEELESVAHG